MRMKIPTLASILFAISCTLAADPILDYELPVRNPDTYRGSLTKYYLNGIIVHMYESVEAYRDWSIVFENERGLVVLEPQSMPNSAKELRRYLEGLGKPIMGILVSYHGVGPDSFPGVPSYASPAAMEYFRSGKIAKKLKELSEDFRGVDPKVILPLHEIVGDSITIGGIRFLVRRNDDAHPMPGIDVALPAHKIYYMHMLGGDTHTLVHTLDEVDPMIEFLQEVKKEGYEIFLCSHHSPESVIDLDAKIEYLRMLKEVAGMAKTAEEFVSEMDRHAPTLKGELYLELTAENLYR